MLPVFVPGLESFDFPDTLGSGTSWTCGANSLCAHWLEDLVLINAKTKLKASSVSLASANWAALTPGSFPIGNV